MHRRQQMVTAKLSIGCDGLDQRQCGGRAIGHAYRHGTIQLHHR